MSRCVLIIVLFVMIIMPGIGWSAEENMDKKEIFTLAEIIVSATKTEETRRDISNAVILVDKIDIEESAANSLGDLLGNEQGIDLRTYGNYGGASEEIHIRGMGADGTQILVNGIAINSPSLGTADAGRISLNSIEKIEVVKGAGSLLYGTGAMAGTINVITKKPEKDVTDLRIGVGYGTNSTYEISAEQGMYLTEDIGYYLTANKKETGGFRSNSDLDHKDISFNFVYDGEQGQGISLYGAYLDRSYGLPGVKTPAGTTDFFVNGVKLYDSESSNLLNAGGDEDMHLVLVINCSPFGWLKLNLKGTYLNMENYNKNIYYYYALSGSKTWVTNKVKGIEGNADIDLFKGVNLLVGGEYKKYVWENKGITLDEDGLDVDGSGKTTGEGLHTFGLFTEAQYRPNDYLKMIAGLRREEHSEFGTEYVPRFGIVINPHEVTAIKLNYGKHYKAPTPNDLFWPYEDWGWGMGTQGNRSLKPETGKHSDAGIEQSFLDDKLFMNATYFNWDIKDKISWIPEASYFYTPQNLDRYKGEGWEVGTAIGPFFNTTFSLSYTSSDTTEDVSGGVVRQARYTADSYFKGDMNYFNESGFTLTATFRYTGDRPGHYSLDTDTEPDVLLSAYYTVDLNIGQRLFDKWLLSLKCNNLFDEEYDTYTASFMDQTTGVSSMERYPGAGRSFLLGISYKY
ncbi:MAG TPA: TonB-dependent receptor [Desulfatiglandales bacterium]|nr:TonB-dependent receptor [Desulfatiglandales bacterium]